MNEPDENRIRELAWRRELTEGERAELRAWLAAHPEARVDWDVEMRLSGLMGSLPDMPVPSNFTARVLQAVERDSARPAAASASRRFWWLHKFVPRTAVAVLVMGFGLFAYHHQEMAKRQALAQGLAAMPDVESLQNFETIRHMTQAPAPDTELLALMQ